MEERMPGTKPAAFFFFSIRGQPITQRRVAKLILLEAEMNREDGEEKWKRGKET